MNHRHPMMKALKLMSKKMRMINQIKIRLSLKMMRSSSRLMINQTKKMKKNNPQNLNKKRMRIQLILKRSSLNQMRSQLSPMKNQLLQMRSQLSLMMNKLLQMRSQLMMEITQTMTNTKKFPTKTRRINLRITTIPSLNHQLILIKMIRNLNK